VKFEASISPGVAIKMVLLDSDGYLGHDDFERVADPFLLLYQCGKDQIRKHCRRRSLTFLTASYIIGTACSRRLRVLLLTAFTYCNLMDSLLYS
jgi:cellulose synthase/poly-beta-1,6-N-acetylglucosamine synthase-like glycosyltransferase